MRSKEREQVGGWQRLYDIFLNGTNILIEIHGDYWHCNPQIPSCATPKKDYHFRNIENDKFKIKLAAERGYELLIIWEHDIRKKTQVLVDFLELIKTKMVEWEKIKINQQPSLSLRQGTSLLNSVL